MTAIFLCELLFVSPCFAQQASYREEENLIRNQKKEYQAVVYYKNGEKIKTEYKEGEKGNLKYSSNKVLREAKELQADKVVFIHNHPSGSINLSKSDCISREKEEQKFQKNNIDVEHVIVTKRKERKY